jgi:hypothetical protein
MLQFAAAAGCASFAPFVGQGFLVLLFCSSDDGHQQFAGWGITIARRMVGEGGD